MTSAVLAPVLAEAADASQPAWPPPITTTSYGVLVLVSDTVANVRRTTAADRTLGACPQSTRARAETATATMFDATTDCGMHLQAHHRQYEEC